jgi:uncharacterized lipoprotein YehR (DUF1307 family)
MKKANLQSVKINVGGAGNMWSFLAVVASVFSLVLVFSVQAVGAAEKQMKIKGTIDAGTMMSNVVTDDGKSYSFVSDSKVGNKIFNACKVGDMCSITALIEDDEVIQSVSAVKKLPNVYLTIPATEKKEDKNIKERKKVELKGIIQLKHNPAGRYYGLTVGKEKDYTLAYVWDVDNNLSDKLNDLIDSKQKVTVKGTLRIWTDGSASFDNAAPIEIYK